jgi:hypothetical protein
MQSCPISMPVAVRSYVRFRYGKWETIISYCRSLPNR